MRVSPGGLLVGLAVAIALLVQVRTVLAFAGIYLTGTETAVVVTAGIVLIVLWAILPDLRARTDSIDESGGDR